ncbi:MAG: hypothetical protein O3B95_04745 [Chloroflexi bacterium]|nr:hypothetical protein [Chloroflexota bacterium]
MQLTSAGLVMVARDDKAGPMVALTSSDGTTWSRTGSSPPLHGIPHALAHIGSTLAVVGSSFSNDSVFWYADSLDDWYAAEPRPHIDTRKSAVDVVAMPNGFISAINQKSNALLFASDDGRSWREFSRFADSEFMSLALYRSGVIAVGYDRERNSGVIWTSENGVEWRRLVPSSEFEGVRLDLVVSEGREVIVIGHRIDDDTVVVWRSDDAASWEALPSNLGELAVRDAVFDESGLVLAGGDRGLNSAVIWTSADGRAWRRVPHDVSLFTVR